MEYSYEKILKLLLSEIPISPSDNVYGITFVAGQGYGKSTIAKILSKKLGLYITSNDRIRRIYDELGFDNTKYEDDIKKMANDRTLYLLENKTSHIIDANMEFYWEMASNNYKNHNAKLYFIELKCNEEEVIRRIQYRAKKFDEDDNYSRASLQDYYIYLERKKEKGIPQNLIYYTINSDTDMSNIEKQVDGLIKKIKDSSNQIL